MRARGVFIAVGFCNFPVLGRDGQQVSHILWALDFHSVEEFVYRFRSEVWQQFDNIIEVYFFNVDPNLVFIWVVLRFLDLLEDEIKGARDDSAIFLAFPLHRVRFPWASLPISEDTHLLSIHGTLDKLR